MCRNSILMTCHYLTLGCASDWMKEMKHYTDLRSDLSSVRNFCAHSPDVIPVVASWDVGSFLWLGPHLTCLTTLSSFAQQHSCLVILKLWLTIISILESQISLYVFSSKYMKAFFQHSICVLLAVHNELPLYTRIWQNKNDLECG